MSRNYVIGEECVRKDISTLTYRRNVGDYKDGELKDAVWCE